jgi:hypothetical protein
LRRTTLGEGYPREPGQVTSAILLGMRRDLVTLLAALAVTLVGCGESPTAKQRAEKQEAERRERANRAEQEQRSIVAELAAPHNAVIIDRRSFGWTADVQDALMPEGERPVAGVASLSDVERDGKSHVVRLLYGDFFRTSIVLMLRCNRPAETTGGGWFTGDRMLRMTSPRYAFVAKIDSVKAQRGLVPNEGRADVERAGWIAEGRCLALRKMPVEAKTRTQQLIDKALEQK